MAHRHSKSQMKSYGRAYSEIAGGLGVVWGATRYSARVAATLAFLRKDLRIGGSWTARWDGGVA